MKKPFYLFFTPCNPIDVEPIDHGNILQPEYQQDYEYSFPRLNIEQAEWLQKNLQMRYPQGHRWLNTGC